MIAIIGAGPAGTTAAAALARAGYEVKVFEEHQQVGSPVQCTGVLTHTVSGLVEPKSEFVANKIKRIMVIAPDNSSASLRLKHEEYIFDRTKFDCWLAARAQDAGAKIFTGHRFLDYNAKKSQLKVRTGSSTKTYRAERVIGADGPQSQVAKSVGIYGKREFFIGSQAVVRVKCDAKVYKTYFGSVCPGLFAWAVPEDDEHVRIGLADRSNPNALFQKFWKRLGSPEIVSRQGGLIPVYNPKLKTSIADNKVLLVGDAASQVKATTAGGIIQAMTAAKIAAECIIDGKNYDNEWRKVLGRELRLHLMIRKLLDNFSDDDYNELVRIIGKKKIRSILESESRDRPVRLVLKCLLADIRLAKFGLRAFS